MTKAWPSFPGFSPSFRVWRLPGKISFLGKSESLFLALCGLMSLSMGDRDAAKTYLMQGQDDRASLDAAPNYGAKHVRFYYGDSNAVAYDDMGLTAMAGIEKFSMKTRRFPDCSVSGMKYPKKRRGMSMKPDRFHPHVSSQSSLHRELSAQFYSKNHIPFVIAVLSSLLLGLLNLMLSWMDSTVYRHHIRSPRFHGTFRNVPFERSGNPSGYLFKLMDYFSRPRFLEKAVRQYKDLAFHKLTQKNISSFQEESTATYISAMSNDIASIEQNLLENQFCSGSQWDSVFRICFMMLSYSPLLTAASALLSFLPFLGSMAAGDRMKTAETRVSQRNEQFVASLKDSLSASRSSKVQGRKRPYWSCFPRAIRRRKMQNAEEGNWNPSSA